MKRTGYWDDIDCKTCYGRAAKKGDIETMKKMDATLKDDYPENELARGVCHLAVMEPLPAVMAYLCEIDDKENTLGMLMAWRCIEKGYVQLLETLEKMTVGKLNLATYSFLHPAIFHRKLSVVKWLVDRGATFLDWKGAAEHSDDFIEEVRNLLIGYNCSPAKEQASAFNDFVKNIKGFPEQLKNLE